MDNLTRVRKITRLMLDKCIKTVEDLLPVDTPDSISLQTAMTMMSSTNEKLLLQNDQMQELRLANPEEEEGADMKEAEDCAGYESRFQETMLKARNKLYPSRDDDNRSVKSYVSAQQDVEAVYSQRSKESGKVAGVKLPKYEIEQFSGEYEDWLGWWAQFERIHLSELDEAQKFAQLKRAMKDNTRAKAVVNKYAASVTNYPKAVQALINRYGNKDKLIDVYIRELQTLIIETAIKRAVKDKQQLTLEQLYDKLETSLNNLQSLIDVDKSPFLFPMVFSCLPPHIMREWERNEKTYRFKEDEDEEVPKLSRLMKFLANEVECEDSVRRASRGYKVPEQKKEEEKKGNSSRQQQNKNKQDIPTVAGLVNVSEAKNCIFCNKHNDSSKCRGALKMSKADKEKKIQEAKVCYTCFTKGHRSKECPKKAEIKCTNSNCNKQGHYEIMCYQGQTYNTVPPPGSSAMQQPTQQPSQQSVLFPAYAANSTATQSQTNITMPNVFTSAEVLHPTLRLGIKGGDGNVYEIRAAIDTMSAHSYLLKKVIKGTKIIPTPLKPGEKRPVFRHAVFSGGFIEVEHDKYGVELHALDWSYSITATVYDQDQISSGIPCAPPQAVLEELQQYGIELTDSYPTEIDLLIGSNLASKLFTGNQCQLPCGVAAMQTKFGWIVMGCPDFANDGGLPIVEHALVNLAYPNCLWELEAIGITDSPEKQTKAEEDAAALEHFRKTVERLPDGQYQVAIPWKQGHPPLPSNRAVAEKRLVSATKKLLQKGKFYDYEEVFEEWLKEGIISEIDPGDQGDENLLHHLSHRAVFREDHITTKIRPVFDASCRSVYYLDDIKYEHPSLNDCTVKGPNMLDNIVNIHLRFREDVIAAIADIRKAFLMIKIKKKDRKKLRFLWWKSYHLGTFRVFQHNCVVFGVNCSPFLLIVVIEHHLDFEEKAGSSPTVIKKLRKSLYVDNVATSFPNNEVYENFKEESVAMLGRAKFDLRLWESNADKEIGPEPSNVLGIKWDRRKDELFCHVLEEKEIKVVTKKTILSAIARVYDPLGMLSPVVLVPKMLIQKCWQLKLQWEEAVPDDIAKSFLEWLDEMSLCEQAKIARCIGVPTSGSSLHVFSDASFSGYAAVVYLRLVEEENVSVKFVLCRARVAPLKNITINRLELIACEIATRLASTVIEALEWQHVPVTYWTDSTTAKAWIERNREWGTFVHNRVKKIREKSSAEQWQHVPGSMNPADLPSRGCGMKELIESRWLTGPSWLTKEPSYWPGGELFYDEEAVNAEMKKTAVTMVNLPMDVPWYSTWKCKLGDWKDIVNIAAWMLRFTRNCKRKKDKQELISGPLSFEQIREAEFRVFYMMQLEEQFNPKKLSLRTTEKDDLIRVETKLTYREDNNDFKYPVLIPGNHYLTELLIRQEHNRNSHAGAQFLLAHLREKVWILYGRKAIANVLKGCLCCLRYTAKAFDPVTAPLPKNRIKDAAPFEISGIDFAGPIFLKGKKKSWIALYTCAVYRAVHLELVDNLTTEMFLLSLRKFIARRGRPSVIYTDNGTNFVGANNYLREVDWTKIADEDNCGPIKWIFNPPSAPWWGGWWERLVRSMKELLVRNLGLEVLGKEEMSAILCDIEATLNGRPLTYVYESDTFTPLTPALFLHGPKSHGNPDLDLLDKESAVKRVQFRQQLMENLRERFRKEYLGQLIHRRRQSKEVDLKVGDAVLIEMDNIKRCMWPMGVITEFFVGQDGVIRTCKIKLKKGGSMVRPVQRLYPLELTQSYIQEAPAKVQQQIKTRSGRVIRRPSP